MKIINGKAVLEGERTGWGFRVMVVWPNLIEQSDDGGPVLASYFGGTAQQDPGDNGETASGARTRNPDGTENPIRGCSLPHDGRVSETAGSPLPRLAYHTSVQVRNPANGLTLTVPLLDDGPAFGTEHAIDLTRQTFHEIGGDFDAGLVRVEVTILDGAHFLSAELQQELIAQGLIPAPGHAAPGME